MRVLHTSDWHLGHLLHDLPRDREHAAFLDWLCDTIAAEAIDAVLISGDVFDAGNPPARALAAWYGFVAAARRRRPHLTVVAIAGNHDSPARLTAPAPLLAAAGVHVIGTVGRDADGAIDAGPLVVPLEDGSYIQAGIVSWGLTASSGVGCEETATFSAYTDISHFVPWLNEVLTTNP